MNQHSDRKPTPFGRIEQLLLTQLTVLSLIPAGCGTAQTGPTTIPATHFASSSTIQESTQGHGASVGFPEFPTLSPDGQWTVFAWVGDLWAMPTAGGTATRITALPAEERRSAFSPDGRSLAFESDRDGARNLYIMSLDRSDSTLVPGEAQRVTMNDRPEALGGFSSDGTALLFSSDRAPAIYNGSGLFRVVLLDHPSANGDLRGGVVTQVTQAFGTFPRAASDGRSVVFVRNRAGMERPKYRGSGSQEIFRLNLADGTFNQLTNNPANDSDAFPLPDGSIVFISSRDGQNNLWKLGPGAGDSAAVQLTKFAPTKDQYTIGHGVRDLAVSADGRTAVFCVWDRMYRLDLSAAGSSPTPIDVKAAADGGLIDYDRRNLDKDASEAALSPDGKTLAVIARGEVFVRNTQEGYPTRRVTSTTGRERDIAWSPDGQWLYFCSDEPSAGGNVTSDPRPQGAYGIFRASVELARDDLAPKKPERKKNEKNAEAGKEEPKPEPAKEAEPGAAQPANAEPADKAEKPETKKGEAKDSKKKEEEGPDHGKRWADALRFKIEPVVLIDDDARSPMPSPDGKRLLYSRGQSDVMLREIETRAASTPSEPTTADRLIVHSPAGVDAAWTPDSRHVIAAITDLDYNADTWIIDTGAPSAPAPGSQPAQGDSAKHASTTQEPDGSQSDPHLGWEKLSTGLPAVNITRHPDTDSSPRLSADGKVLVFLSERGTQDDEVDVWAVYLDKELEGKTAYELDDYFKKAGDAAGKRKPLSAKPAKKPATDKSAGDAKTDAPSPAKDDKAGSDKKDEKADPPPSPSNPIRFDASDAYLRVRRITTISGSEGNLELTPGADRIIFSATVDGERSLYSVDQKGKDRKVLVAGDVRDVRSSLTGDKVSFIKAGVVSTTPKVGGKVDALPIDAPVVIDVARQQRQKFLEAARILGTQFYHPTLKGLDWTLLTSRYADLAQRTRTSAAFNRVVQSLFGELDGSHTGINGGDRFTAPPINTGYLGVRVEPVAGGYKVARVTLASPADEPNTRIKPGEIITAVDGARFAADANALPDVDFNALFAGKAGKEVLVEVKSDPATATPSPAPADATPPGAADASHTDASVPAAPALPPNTRLVLVSPIAYAAWGALEYQDEVLRRRATVEKLSDGRLGYLHIRSMGEESVREFERDLYAAANGKKGLIIDVRDNGGGYTADILLSSLTAPRHAYAVPRGVDPTTVEKDVYPRDRRLIYAWTRPLNVLINQNSFSNAEIFAHAIKTINRGRLVGTATFGGVISTGAATLIDGTMVRTPGRGWYLPDGSDQENNGAKPDVDVPQRPEDEAAGRDMQLEAAVKDLLERVK